MTHFIATILVNVRLVARFVELVLTVPRTGVCRVIQKVVGLCYISTHALRDTTVQTPHFSSTVNVDTVLMLVTNVPLCKNVILAILATI